MKGKARDLRSLGRTCCFQTNFSLVKGRWCLPVCCTFRESPGSLDKTMQSIIQDPNIVEHATQLIVARVRLLMVTHIAKCEVIDV